MEKEILRHASLFTGIGGFDLAAEYVGWKNIFQVENNLFCQEVLKKNFTQTDKFLDIKDFDGTPYKGMVDIISGGFPCQDISISGINNGRKGLDGDRSGLFYQMVRVINEVKPLYFIFENSPQVINLLPTIIKSFKEIEYDITGTKLSARMFGFPHKRERFYGIGVANTDSLRWNEVVHKNSIFEKVHKSKEILGVFERNKTKFIRTLSPSLLGKTNTDYVRTTDGVSNKLDKDRLTALGNAVIPVIVYFIFKEINKFECIEK